MPPIRTHYDNLQVQEDASPEVIHGAWTMLTQKWHPDRHPDQRERAEQASRIIADAYRVLSDPQSRRQHDAWIRAERTRRGESEPAPMPGADPIPAGDAWQAPNASRPGAFGVTLITMAWLGVFALMWVLFDDYLERRDYPNRDLVVEQGAYTELVLRRNPAGHYLLPGTINGEPVIFLFDTGATQVSVPAHLAERLGLPQGARGRALTANGPVEVHQTRIRELAIGPFVLKNVPAHLNPGMSINPGANSEQVLLGMSVLRHLDFAQRGQELILNLP
jgi:aspartyl protease family protein